MTAPTGVAEAEAAPATVQGPIGGDIYELAAIRDEDGRRTLLVADEPRPRPGGPVVAYAEDHHSHREFREIESLQPQPFPTAVVVQLGGDGATLCDSPIVRTRRLHALAISDDAPEGAAQPSDDAGTTYLAFELGACPEGLLALVGATRAEVAVHTLNRTSLTDRAPLELVELVRARDMIWNDHPVAAADFRLLRLPGDNGAMVVGENAWLIREGRVWNERFRGNPSHVVVAGTRAFFWVSTEVSDWVSSIDCAYPTYDAGSCEVVDASGTPTNVRAGPSGRSEVLTTIASGATVAADDHVGSWYRLLTSPPGWAHESGLRCTALPEGHSPCD